MINLIRWLLFLIVLSYGQSALAQFSSGGATSSVTANAGTNLNTSLLALEGGGNIASLVAQLGAVSTSPTANTVLDRLKTLNTTLGSPFQAGGSIGNASFGISGTLPAFAATPAFKIDQTTPGTTNLVALGANQSINVAQMNGVVTSMGTGVAGTGTQRVTLSNTDPCASPDIAKSSARISITSATTTSLVAVSGSTTVYVCGYSFTISPSATSADTAAFEYGTGASCTSPTLLTGTYGNGDLTSAAPVTHIAYGGAFTTFKSAASAGICMLTAGTAVSVQGVLTYIQQ